MGSNLTKQCVKKRVLSHVFVKYFVNPDPLCIFQAWIATRRVSKDDWMEWLRRLGIELLKESPSPALRSCWALAQTYNPLARLVCVCVGGGGGQAKDGDQTVKNPLQ